MSIEPFGYFKAEPFGWTDCDEFAEGAQSLYDQAAIDSLSADIATLEQGDKQVRARLGRVEKERDELVAALERAASVIESADFPVDASITRAIAGAKESA